MKMLILHQKERNEYACVYFKHSVSQNLIGQQDRKKHLIQHSLERFLLKSVPTASFLSMSHLAIWQTPALEETQTANVSPSDIDIYICKGQMLIWIKIDFKSIASMSYYSKETWKNTYDCYDIRDWAIDNALRFHTVCLSQCDQIQNLNTTLQLSAIIIIYNILKTSSGHFSVQKIV